MEVPEPLAAWFLAIGLVSREAVRAGKGTSWVLDDEATNTFLNGVAFAELISMLSSQRGIPEPPLSGVKPADTPLARLGNWSILSPRLSTFGIEIDPDTKSLIVVGDTDVLVHLASTFYESFGEELAPEEPVDTLPPRHQPEPPSHPRDSPELANPRHHSRGATPRSANGARSPSPSGRSEGSSPADDDDSPLPENDQDSTASLVTEHLQLCCPSFRLPFGGGPLLPGDDGGHEGLLRFLGEPGPNADVSQHHPREAARFFDRAGASARPLAGCLVREGPASLSLLLPLFAAGLRSADGPCAAAAATALAQLGRALAQTPLLPDAYDWFCGPGGALSAVLRSLGAGPRSGGDGLEEEGADDDPPGPRPAALSPPLPALLLERFCARSLRDLFGVRLKRLAPSPPEWLRLLLLLVPLAADRPALRRALARDGAAAALASDCCACAAPASPPELRLAALAALEALWSVCPEGVEADADASRAALAAFRAAARSGGGGAEPTGNDGDADGEGSFAVQVAAVEALFHLLHVFIGGGSSFAPLVYKALIFSLIENHHAPPARDAALDLMADALARHPDIPVGVLAEPLAKRVDRLGLCEGDFPLLAQVAASARLEPRHAAALVDALVPPALAPGGGGVALPAQRCVVLLAPRLFERGGADHAPDALKRLAARALAPFDPRLMDEDEGASAEGSLQRALSFSFLLSLAQLRHPGVSAALRPPVDRRAKEAAGAGRAGKEAAPQLRQVQQELRQPPAEEWAQLAAEATPGIGAGQDDGAWAMDEDEEEDEEERALSPDKRRTQGGKQRMPKAAPFAGPPPIKKGPPPPPGKSVAELRRRDLDRARQKREEAEAAKRAEEERRRAQAARAERAVRKKTDEVLGESYSFWDKVLHGGNGNNGRASPGAKGPPEPLPISELPGLRELQKPRPAPSPRPPKASPSWQEQLRQFPPPQPLSPQRRASQLLRPPSPPPQPERGTTPEPTWAQQLIIEALNLRLATNPDEPLPEGFERRLVEVPMEAGDGGGAAGPGAAAAAPEGFFRPRTPDDVEDAEAWGAAADVVDELLRAATAGAAGEGERRKGPAERRVQMRWVAKVARPLLGQEQPHDAAPSPAPALPAPPARAPERPVAAAAAAKGAAPPRSLTAGSSAPRPTPRAQTAPRQPPQPPAPAPFKARPAPHPPPPASVPLAADKTPRVGPDGFYPFERVALRFITAYVDDALGAAARDAVRRAGQPGPALPSARSRSRSRSASPAKPRAPRGESPANGGGGPSPFSTPAAGGPTPAAPTPLSARGAAAVAARLEQLKKEEAEKREQEKVRAAAERERQQRRAAELKVLVAKGAEERERREQEAKAEAEAKAAAEAARRREAEEKDKKRREAEKARLAEFQRRREEEAEARRREEEDAKRKAEEAQEAERRKHADRLNERGVDVFGLKLPKHLEKKREQLLEEKRRASEQAKTPRPPGGGRASVGGRSSARGSVTSLPGGEQEEPAAPPGGSAEDLAGLGGGADGEEEPPPKAADLAGLHDDLVPPPPFG